MKVYRYQDANQFYDRVKDYLLRDEALHNRLLVLCHSLIHNPEAFEEKPLLATVEVEGDIVAVAIRTRLRNLLLSKIQDFGAIEAIAQNLHLTENSLAEVNAPNAEAKAFAETWRSLTSQSYEIKMALRAFQLKQVEKISQATGELRQATESDTLTESLRERELLIDWFEAFVVEALGIAATNTERAVERHLQRGTAYLWEDETPVSMACHVGITPNGAAISVVYTPPEHRRKGYASSCVAALSQILLSRGHKYCFLFTDLANPTSNHIYQAIGYQSVGDLYDCSFL
ncbi:GNAT family N-acetyltransferase [Tolypothrix sp. VBCCA 56010]|uniref:GNAT family N-acetyltransferase n=1 Tax=Tolypothrix sp. VBCCA 56010 TaxID=3137731 RepID=UPI003D7CD7F1